MKIEPQYLRTWMIGSHYVYGAITRYGQTFQTVLLLFNLNVVVLQPQDCLNNPEPYMSYNQFGLVTPYKSFEAAFKSPYSDRTPIISYFNKSDLDKLSPNCISNSIFWKMLHQMGFELSPVCGNMSKNIKEVNDKNAGIFKYIVDTHKDIFTYNKKILEIGYGYGSFVEYLRKRGIYIKKYYGIDFFKRFKKRFNKNIYTFLDTDGWTIPDDVDNDLDIVFSSNVFQHLTLEQKTNYFKLCYDKLKKGGHFVFTSFLSTPDLLEKKPYLWSFKDDSNVPYVHFFDQFIAVNDYNDLMNIAQTIGYSIHTAYVLHENIFGIILKK